jgi:DNA ligase-1
MTRPHIVAKHLITKPLLAAKVDSKNPITELQFPLGVTQKVDGIRALMIDKKVVSRTFKMIPNKFIQATMQNWVPDGMDMELTMVGGSFQDHTSAIMSEDGEPRFHIWVIDWVTDSLDETYAARIKRATDWTANYDMNCWDKAPFRWTILSPQVAYNQEDLLRIEEQAIEDGFEGVMVRKMDAPYKCGRATFKEGILTKVKRFQDQEAVIKSVVELYHNATVAEKDAFGRTKRSTKQENMRPAGTLGALVVEGVGGDYAGKQWNVGTGFDQATRDKLWANRTAIVGKMIKVVYFPTGTKDVPRFPTWAGFRDPRDT